MRKVFPPIPDSWRKSSWQCGIANMDALVVTPRCKSRFGSVGANVDARCTLAVAHGSLIWLERGWLRYFAMQLTDEGESARVCDARSGSESHSVEACFSS